MEHDAREELERSVRELCERGDMNAAATRALRGYGPEIYSVLVAILRDRTTADDAFSLFSENLWKNLGGFGWASSLRTWAYVLARNAAFRHSRDSQRRARKVATDGALDEIVQAVRTETQSILKTEKKTRLQALRESLPEDEQMLLILRLERELAWNDLARVLHDGEGELDDAALAREAARLRKRFQLVKDRLVERARREGLLPRKPA